MDRTHSAAAFAAAALFVVTSAGAAGAAAASSSASNAATDAQIEQLNQSVRDLQAEVDDLKRSQNAQYTDIQNQRGQDVQISFKNGRPTFKSSDGEYTLSLRALVQYDSAYYAQGKAPAGTDFSTGSNFRRARAGFDGTVGDDWSYEFIYDFGGSGTEASTISSAYIQYDGLGFVHVRAGAYPPPESFEDSTSAADLTFLERSQPTDLARSIAGSDGRDSATAFSYNDHYFVAASLTSGLVGETAVFDKQEAFVGRAAYRIIAEPDVNFAIGGDTTYVFKLGDLTAGPDSAHAFRLRERPELNVDDESTRLVDTGSIDADKVWEWGLEATGNWHSLYAQGGYFGYQIGRRNSPLPDNNFNGWYAQASWMITGESKPYRADRGAYASPAPAEKFSFSKGTWGAWELAGRYSVLDLNDNAGVAGLATPTGGVRGGEQKITTVGVNWYPNTVIRFLLDYQHTNVDRLSSTGGSLDAHLDAVSLRAQFAF
jgi:phosphate-selective porin OprO/OprP